jgi:hypothetical protein
VVGIALLLILGCSRETPTRGKFVMKWEYVEILKGEDGQVNETGSKKEQTAGGGEALGINKQTQSCYVDEVSPTKAKFRLSDEKGANQEAVVESGTTQDIWLQGSSAGIRVRVESITPVKK